MKFNYWRILLLGFGFMGVTLLWGIYNAYVPIFLQAGRPDFSSTAGVSGFGLSAVWTGFIMTFDNIAALFILPWIGAFSDRIWTKFGRRKPFIMGGAPLAFIGFVAIPLFIGKSLIFFMGSIFLTLLAMDLFRTPVVSFMGDITPSPKRSQANGMINLMGGIGGVLAFAVGGLLFKVSVGAPFYFGGIAMLAGCGVLLVFIKEPKPDEANTPEEKPALLNSLKHIIRDHDKSAIFLLGAIFFWFLGYGALEVFFTSFAVNRLGVDSGEATFLLAYFSLAIIVFSPLSGWIGSKVGRKRTISIGIIGFAALLAIGFFMETVLAAKIILLLCGISWSFILVNSLPMALDMAPVGHIGVYTGLYYLASQLSNIVGPILSGKIIDIFNNDYRTAFLYGTVTLIIALLFMIPVKRGEAV
ncbi:MAG: MFS transporter [Candidatus Marinimicrobia bacterium]|nr:MFS transporter [Candidatus Neomarinimicrobiota bacterium]